MKTKEMERRLLLNKYMVEFSDCAKPVVVSATGSIVLGHSTDESDFDIIVLVHESDFDTIGDRYAKLGYERSETRYSDDRFAFFRKMPENINLIVTNEPELYDRWVRCGYASIELSLSKEQRQILFSTMIDDNE